MSMSTYVKGLRTKTVDVVRKRQAVEACVKAGVEVPKELIDFFGERDPKYILEDDGAGLEMEIPHYEGEHENQKWIEIKVSEIPQGVERVRFINSW